MTENGKSSLQVHQNQHFDESLDVADGEDVASMYTPSPSQHGFDGREKVPFDSHSKVSSADDSDEYDPGEREGPTDTVNRKPEGNTFGPGHDEGDIDEDEDDDDDDDDDDDGNQLEGVYDPADFEHLQVTTDLKDLFRYISHYTPQVIELEHCMKPFIPDFIPAVGDIDAFIKVTRPDMKENQLGLLVIDEPCAKQSDPVVLDLQLRAISKQSSGKAVVVKSLSNAECNPRAIESWMTSISDLHRSKPPPAVHYSKNMPDIDTLMQEWPAEFEEALKNIGLPTADMECSLSEYTDIICSILDIPVYKNRIQSLHVLFTLFSEFKNSQHFKSLADDNQLDNVLKNKNKDQSNTLIL